MSLNIDYQKLFKTPDDNLIHTLNGNKLVNVKCIIINSKDYYIDSDKNIYKLQKNIQTKVILAKRIGIVKKNQIYLKLKF